VTTTLNASTAGAGGFIATGDNSGSLALQTAGTTAVTIDTSQNVGIGTNSPTQKLTLSGTGALGSTFQAKITNGSQNMFFGANATAAEIQSTGGVPIYLNYGGNDVVTNIGGGNLLVGTTNSSITTGIGLKANVSDNPAAPYYSTVGSSTSDGAAAYSLYSTGSGAYKFYASYAGVVHATSTSITAISDQRLKENVRDLNIGLSEIMMLQPRRFDWKQGKGQDKKDAVGFIAQEFESVLPNSISMTLAGEDGIEYKAISYEELVPTLVKAIQELKAINDTQAKTINALTARVVALEAK
jgi:hypothetical protein